MRQLLTVLAATAIVAGLSCGGKMKVFVEPLT